MPALSSSNTKKQPLGALAVQDKLKMERAEVKGNNSQPSSSLPKISCTSKASHSGEISAASQSHFAKEPRGMQHSPHTRDSSVGRKH